MDDYVHYLQKFSYYFQRVQTQIAINHVNYDKTRFGIIASDFNEIIRSNPEFKDLLLFTCFMSSQYISINYLKQLKEGVIVDNFIYELQKYSLIYVNDNVFSMHRFLQRIGLYYIITEFSENEIITALEKLVEILAYSSAGVEKSSPQECLYLPRHIESMIQNRSNERGKQEYNIRLSNTLLSCYIHFKPREFIKDFSKKIIDGNEHINALSQKDFAKLLEICGNACLFFRKYEEADKYLSMCLTACTNNDKLLHPSDLYV